MLVCSIQEVKLGIGRHSLDPVLLGNFTEIMLYSWISSLFLVAGISSVKISVGFFLLRVVNGTKYKRLIIGMIGKLPNTSLYISKSDNIGQSS